MTRSHQKALSATGVQIAVPGRRREILRPFPTTTDFHRHQHTTSPSIYYPTHLILPSPTTTTTPSGTRRSLAKAPPDAPHRVGTR